MSQRISAMIVDDHPGMREAIGAAVRTYSKATIDVVAEAHDGRSALELARTVRPDVVFMDIAMPDMSGLEATRRLKATMPGTAVVVISLHEENGFVQGARQAGAVAFVAKSRIFEELESAIDAAVAAVHGSTKQRVGA